MTAAPFPICTRDGEPVVFEVYAGVTYERCPRCGNHDRRAEGAGAGVSGAAAFWLCLAIVFTSCLIGDAIHKGLTNIAKAIAQRGTQ